MRKCLYVNCNSEVIGRNNKKYCCIEHKRIQKKYRQRLRKKLINNENL